MVSNTWGLFAAVAVQQLFPLRAFAQHNDTMNACARVALEQSEALEQSPPSEDFPSDIVFVGFSAKAAYDCITSVALDTDEAVSMIDVIRGYLDFQTTLAYNADPPKSYQQPPIDIHARLDELASNVRDGTYANQYEFDLSINSIVIGVHDGHFSFNTGVFGLYSWNLPETIVAISSDGKEIPEVYARSDILNRVENASPIVEIENESVFTYLQSYVNRTGVHGFIEPHAEWNQLTWDAPSELSRLAAYPKPISTSPTAFQSTMTYNGESLSGKFGNGSSFEWVYQAGSTVNLLSANLTSAENIQNGLVRNVQPDDSDSLESRSLHRDSGIQLMMGNMFDMSFPVMRRQNQNRNLSSIPYFPKNMVAMQNNFGQNNSIVSGYVLKDISVGVLSIPTFSVIPGALEDPGSSLSFSKAVDDFIQAARSANVEKIIIDLSGNPGGVVFQGIDTFKKFFPDAEPPISNRGAATQSHRILGGLLTGLAGNDKSYFNSSIHAYWDGYGAFIPMISTYSTTLDGEPWESYEDFLGGPRYGDAEFSNPAQYDLEMPAISLTLNQNITGYGNNIVDYEQPWSGDDIILLQDGSCASTCSLFSDLMKKHGGVKSVVVGGIPQHGPMQAVSGTRGPNTITMSLLTTIIDQVRGLQGIEGFSMLMEDLNITSEDIESLPPSLTEAPWNVRGGNVNTLDIVRPDSDDPDMPWQFAYEAADCRLFYTAPMIRDMTELYHVVASYANGNDSVCVPGSTDGHGLPPKSIFVEDPGFDGEDIWANANATSLPDNGNLPDGGGNGDETSAAAGLMASFGIALPVAFGVTMMLGF